MATEAELIGKSFTLRMTASRLAMAERLRYLIPGYPKVRSSEFFFGVIELVGGVIIDGRRKKIREIKEDIDRWKLTGEDLGIKNGM